MPSVPPIVLSIAGFDPSSGAGVTADIKTAAAHGCFAVTCITALTVQSTQGVKKVSPVAPELVRQTLDDLAMDFNFGAIRIGMLGNGAVAEQVAEFLEELRPTNLVVDPIIRASSGAALLDADGVDILRSRILPLASVVTPNTLEAEALTAVRVDDAASQAAAASSLLSTGARAVVVTGGHLAEASDLLLWASGEERFSASKIDSSSTHGTGCAFATSLACNLANGLELVAAVRAAKDFVFRAIASAVPIGKGIGPVHHLWPLHRQR